MAASLPISAVLAPSAQASPCHTGYSAVGRTWCCSATRVRTFKWCRSFSHISCCQRLMAHPPPPAWLFSCLPSSGMPISAPCRSSWHPTRRHDRRERSLRGVVGQTMEVQVLSSWQLSVGLLEAGLKSSWMKRAQKRTPLVQKAARGEKTRHAGHPSARSADWQRWGLGRVLPARLLESAFVQEEDTRARRETRARGSVGASWRERESR